MRKYKNIRVLGITGGVGAGKSTVLCYLEKRYGARVILCDDAARLLQEPGGICYAPMLRLLGESVLKPDGSFDRRLVAERVFSDEAQLGRLNAIVHPAVKEYVRTQIQIEEDAARGFLVVIEAALLLEEHYELLCDEIWYVYARDEVRRERLKASRGYSDERISRMMERQKPDDFFREHCPFVIDNSSDQLENTWAQIDAGMKERGFGTNCIDFENEMMYGRKGL